MTELESGSRQAPYVFLRREPCQASWQVTSDPITWQQQFSGPILRLFYLDGWAGRRHAVHWFLVLPTQLALCGSLHALPDSWRTFRLTPCHPVDKHVLFSSCQMVWKRNWRTWTCTWPVGSMRQTGACTGHRAAERGSQHGRSWCTRSPAAPAEQGHSCPGEQFGSGCPAAENLIYIHAFCVFACRGHVMRRRRTYHPMSSWKKLFKVIKTWWRQKMWNDLEFLNPSSFSTSFFVCIN